MARKKIYSSSAERQRAYRQRQAGKSKKEKSVATNLSNQRSRQSQESRTGKSIENFAQYPFRCPNCGLLLSEALLFCSDVCRQEAEYVRYVRACYRDGRYKRPDVQEAIQIRLAMILGGGYPEKERRIPMKIRKAVFERDGGRCMKCGANANNVDHIHGSSNSLEHLQLLCVVCHNQKTISSFSTITPESHPNEWAKFEALELRVDSPKPLKICDSEEWKFLWSAILSARRQIVKKR